MHSSQDSAAPSIPASTESDDLNPLMNSFQPLQRNRPHDYIPNANEMGGDFQLFPDSDCEELNMETASRLSRDQHVHSLSSFLRQNDEILSRPFNSQIQEQDSPKGLSNHSLDFFDFSLSPSVTTTDDCNEDKSGSSSTVQDISNQWDNFEIRSTADSAVGEMDGRRSSFQVNGTSYFPSPSQGQGVQVCPITIKQTEPTIDCSDSGVYSYSTSFESTGHPSLLKQSPFMGNESPDDPYSATDWSGIAFATQSPSDPPSSAEPEVFDIQVENYDGMFFHPLSDFGMPPRDQATSEQTTPLDICIQRISTEGNDVISRKIMKPMAENPRLSVFKELFSQAQQKIKDGRIVCLRDLEKHLFQFGHVSSNCTGPLFLRLFREFFDLTRKSLSKIPECDRCRPLDKERYDNKYFLDTWPKVFDHVQQIFKLTPEESERIVKGDSLATTRMQPKNGKTLPPVLGSIKRPIPGPLGHSNKKGSACTVSEQTPQVPVVGSASLKNSKTIMAHSHINKTHILHSMALGTITQNTMPSYMSPLVGANYMYMESTTAQGQVHVHSSEDFRYPSCSIEYPGEVGMTSASLSPAASTSTISFTNQYISSGSETPPLASSQLQRRDSSHSVHVFICEHHGCNKTPFQRKCDLTKHAKTHKRPYKCINEQCEFHEKGFSAEKDRDRHYHDKHVADGIKRKFPCYWAEKKGCTYSSPRMSNVKQHMEKTHGYEYKRTKSVKNTKTKRTQEPEKNVLGVQGSPRVLKSLSSSLSTSASASSTISTNHPHRGRIGSNSFKGTQTGSLDDTPTTLPLNSPQVSRSASPAGVFPKPSSPPPPPQGISPAAITSSSHTQTERALVSFTNPIGAVHAMNRQKSAAPSSVAITVSPANVFTTNGTDDPLHDAYIPSPDDEFALRQNFLHRAPSQLMATASDGYPIRYELFNHVLDGKLR